MFVNTIDNKSIFVNNDNIEIVDLTDSIFKSKISETGVFSYFRVGRNMDMRPDKLSVAAYGSDEYTEMVMKYSMVDNPFALEYNDFLVIPSLTSVYSDVKDAIISNGNGTADAYNFVKNYHKYIDKDKLPTTPGSTGSGDIYSSNAAGGTINTALTGTNAQTRNNLAINATVTLPSYNDLDVRETYGNVIGYGSDYNLTDGNDESYSGGNADYDGVNNNIDTKGYPARESDLDPANAQKITGINIPSARSSSGDDSGSSTGNYNRPDGTGTTNAGSTNSDRTYDNKLNPGYSGGSGSGKSATAINNNLYNNRGVGQGGRGYGDGTYSFTGTSSNLPGISYDDNGDIITTLYDENGNEIPVTRRTNTDTNTGENEGPVEPNMANNNKSGINISNGRIYFGDGNISANPNDITDVTGDNKVDSSLVDCARTGISLGQFLNATLKNNLTSNR